MKRLFVVLFLLTFFSIIKSQNLTDAAENVRIKYKIPEIAYAVVSSDKIFELQVIGQQRVNSNFQASVNNRFHIGSNTKAITSFIAALLVKDGNLKWNTKFFELFPELKTKSNKAYFNITLQDLLTFRAKLPTYTYTFPKPTTEQLTGDYSQQRLQFTKYFLKQPPAKSVNGLTPSNVGYVLAGLMLEKASGKSYKELIGELGKLLGIKFGFDNPNLSDSLQTWGHDENLKLIAPQENQKLNWLLAAGNINISLPDYIKFIQLQLQGLKGKSIIFPQSIFEKLHYGLPNFSFGWFNKIDNVTKNHISFNEGNAGSFITQVKVIKEFDLAFIIFTNSATIETSKGIAVLMETMQKKYSK